MLDALGLSKKNIADLQNIPITRILAAQVAITTSRLMFTPVMGNDFLPHHPFYPEAPLESADIPVIISSALDDAAVGLANFDLTEEELKASLKKECSEKVDRIYKMYRDAFPDVKPFLIQVRMATDRSFRKNAIKQAELKASQPGAPVYYYLWQWPVPTYNGKFGAVHGVDVGAAIHLYREPVTSCGFSEGMLMVDRLSSAWSNFAKTGNPDSNLIPHWPAYNTDTRPTMVFDVNTRVENDYLGDFRLLWEELMGEATMLA